MPDEDPKKPPVDYRSLGDQIHRDVHDRMRAKIEDRRQRWEDKMQRRRAGGYHGGWPFGFHGGGLSGGLLVGLILTGIGVVLLLQGFDIIPDRDLWEFWPVIFIIAGISRAASAYSVTGRMWGGLIALGGILFLLSNLNIIHRDMWQFFWPVILIVAGAAMLIRGMERNHDMDRWRSGGGTPGGISGGMAGGPGGPNPGGASAGPTGRIDPQWANRVHEFAIFGGANRRIDSQEFEGGDAVAMFGGVQLDLRKADTKLKEVNIDVTAAFGGIEIKVPETWAVSMRVTSIFGGYDDKTHAPPPGPEKPPVLVITGATIFGGLGVKN
jgi:predicted membrane protein